MSPEIKKQILWDENIRKRLYWVWIKTIMFQIISLILIGTIIICFPDGNPYVTFSANFTHALLVYLSIRYQTFQNNKIKNGFTS